MPTLLQINIASNWGSTGRIMEQIGLCAQSHGWRSYVTYGRNEYHNPSNNNVIRIGTTFDAYEHYAENLFLDNEGLASRRATKRFLKKVDEIRPDIVHLHIIHDHYLNYPLLFKYLAEKRIPVVWTQHDQWATTGHCCYSLTGCDRWMEECHNCPMSKWYSINQSTRNFKLKKELMSVLPSLTIVPVSDWLANIMRQSHLGNRFIQVIHNGIDIQHYSFVPSNIHELYGVEKGKKIVLGVASLWDERKGLNDFYKIAELLPTEEYAIIIVGKLTEERKQIESGCKMVFVDRTQSILDLVKLYSAAYVFVNPTYQDNYPTTNLESIACGTPVITYNTGGSPEAVDDATGVVVEQGDVEGIVRSIFNINKSSVVSSQCRKRAEEYFDKDKCYEKYVELYNQIIMKST